MIVPQHMTEEEYVAAYKDLPDLNATYVRALYQHNRRRINYFQLLTAYETTDAHKKEVKVKPLTKKLTDANI